MVETTMLALRPTTAAMAVDRQTIKIKVGVMFKVSPSPSKHLLKTGSNMLVSKFW
jgi:hypothetical protein